MNDRFQAIRDALAMNPTPGPWDGNEYSVSKLWSNGEVGIREYIALPDNAEDANPNPADMHWIAACDPATIRELLAERDALVAENDALAAENERLKEDRARFPDKPDDIGRLIEAHIENLKEGKKIADALANRAIDRACRAEAALAEKDKEIADLTKKFETLKQAYDRERRKPTQILGSNDEDAQ